MTRDEVLAYCLAKPGAWRDEPWEGDVVAKVGPKIFAFTGGDGVGLKLGRSREEADEWLAIRPGTDALFLAAMVQVLHHEGLVRIPDHVAPHVGHHRRGHRCPHS